MGDQHAHAALPPGYRFHPSEEILLRYYLTKKNENQEGGFYGSDLIMELNLYDYDPFNLPDAACFSYGFQGRKKHWFCYTLTKETRRRSRKVRTGFWLRKGRDRDIFNDAGDVVLGTRTRFVFYQGNSLKDASRTDWVFYEYALLHHVPASFVLCRVVNKPPHKNSPSEIGLSCCAEESVMAAVRHVGVQHDGCVGSDVVEARLCDEGFDDRENEIAENSIRGGGEHDNLAAPASFALGSQPLPIASFYISNSLKRFVRIRAVNTGSWLKYLEQLLFFLNLDFELIRVVVLFRLHLHAYLISNITLAIGCNILRF